MATKRKRIVQSDEPPEAITTAPEGRRRGRPPGSPSLTRAVEDTVVSFVHSGATFAAAARAAGISPRTLRDWLERGEDRHRVRESTPKLRRFARRVRQAQGEARVLAENRVFEQNPRAWLSATARSTPDDEGWADSRQRAGGSAPIGPELAASSEEELNEALRRLLQVAAERVASPRQGLRGAPERGTP